MTANPRSMRASRSIHLVIPLVPLDEAGEPGLDRRPRLEAEITSRRFDIGKALRHITGLQRQQLLQRRAAQQPLEDGNKVEELLGAVIIAVIDAVGEPISPRAPRAVMSR